MKVLILLFVLFVVPASFYCQANNSNAEPSFNGQWNFESSTNALLGMKAKNSRYSSSLNVTQTAIEIVIHSKSFLELYNSKTGERKTVLDLDESSTYFLDGRGETNVMKDGTKVYSSTEWKGSKLKTSFYSAPASDRKRELLGSVIMELAKDGSSLKLTRSAVNRAVVYLSAENANFDVLTDRSDTYRLASK